MKIIAKTENGFICEIDNQEVKAAMGMLTTSEQFSHIDIGSEITFTKALHNLALIRDLRNSSLQTAFIKMKEAKEYFEKSFKAVSEIHEDVKVIEGNIKKEQI